MRVPVGTRIQQDDSRQAMEREGLVRVGCGRRRAELDDDGSAPVGAELVVGASGGEQLDELGSAEVVSGDGLTVVVRTPR